MNSNEGESLKALSNFFSLRESDGMPEPTVTLQTFDASNSQVAYDNPEAMRHKATLHLGDRNLQKAEAAIRYIYEVTFLLRQAPDWANIRHQYTFEVDRTRVYPNISALEKIHGEGKVNGYAFGVTEKKLRSEGRSVTAFRNKRGGWTHFDIQLQPYRTHGYFVLVGISDDDKVDGIRGWQGAVRAFPSKL